MDSKWRRELKGYMKKKDYVDHKGLSRFKEQDVKYWPKSRDRSCNKDHLGSQRIESVFGKGSFADDHTKGTWCTKKKVGNMRHLIQQSF